MKNSTSIRSLLTASAAVLAAAMTLSGCSFITLPPEAGTRAAESLSETVAETLSETAETSRPDDDLTVTATSWALLPGKDTETTVYKYVTNKPGPKMVIVGGTHGDEVAGWTTALELVEEFNAQSVEGMCGEILVIPQLNKLGDKAVKRYVDKHNGIAYSDLNRAFPIQRADNAAAASIELAEACIQVVREFIGDGYRVVTDQEGLTTNLCIIDLHESRGAQSDGYLGSDLIYTNNAFLMESFLDYYNSVYRKTGEAKFVHDEANKSGSFSMYFSETYPDAVVFTVETNRQVSNGADTIALTTRTRQQRNILNTLFDMVWNRVDKAKFD